MLQISLITEAYTHDEAKDFVSDVAKRFCAGEIGRADLNAAKVAWKKQFINLKTRKRPAVSKRPAACAEEPLEAVDALAASEAEQPQATENTGDLQEPKMIKRARTMWEMEEPPESSTTMSDAVPTEPTKLADGTGLPPMTAIPRGLFSSHQDKDDA